MVWKPEPLREIVTKKFVAVKHISIISDGKGKTTLYERKNEISVD